MADDPNRKSSAQWEQRIHNAGTRVEEELRTLLAFIDTEVVPEVRRNSSVALRKAAQQMEKLAQKMDDHAKGGSQ